MKKSELRSIIRECVQEALFEARLMNNFAKFNGTLPEDERDMFTKYFGPFLGIPLEAGHEIEDKNDQLKKIDAVISKLTPDMRKKYIPILTDFKKFISQQPEVKSVNR